ncbi:hypothetical protein OIE71_29280 [Streptomyces sp. NBC_01725]|uniref:hypothetical protein n=1 Tax=Streptomyces sp. NBC_01725 TaxID=2975923 RepID=UPI002E2CB098|nr:hypothetical protein [Streptomyces sp. NBC_01725]
MTGDTQLVVGPELVEYGVRHDRVRDGAGQDQLVDQFVRGGDGEAEADCAAVRAGRDLVIEEAVQDYRIRHGHPDLCGRGLVGGVVRVHDRFGILPRSATWWLLARAGA